MRKQSRILLVDDNRKLCESIGLLLEKKGYSIQTAHSGHEAFQLLSRFKFDLALLDIFLPDIQGLEIMDFIRTDHPETQMITFTGAATIDLAIEALRKGAFDFLKKPFEYEELQNRVENALHKKRLSAENRAINGKLQQSEDRYQFLVQTSPDIIFTLDDQGRFTFINQAAETLLGYRSDDLIGKPYTHIVYEEDLDKAKYLFHERRTGNRSNRGTEFRLKSRKNTAEPGTFEVQYLPVEMKATGLYDTGSSGKGSTFLGSYGVARDISERKRLEAQFNQAQRMKSLGSLAGGIAHNFNNLLMSIQGNIALLLEQTQPASPGYTRLKNIEHYIDEASNLTGQLLGFARGGKYNLETLDMNQVLQKSAELFAQTKREITVSYSLDDTLKPIEGDQNQLKQVLLNLFVNAWQAMPNGGELRLTTSNQALDERQAQAYDLTPGEYVTISIADTGIGMDEATQERIFEPFFSSRGLDQGTGLGLASVYGIVKNHKGSINVYSQPNTGTTFTIRFPATEKHLPVTEETRMTNSLSRGSETILVVDDQDMVLEVTKACLQELGYAVRTSQSGREAIDMYSASAESIDLILLDLIMPEMGGKETFESLQQIDPGVKVLISSGYSLDGRAREVLQKGALGFIQKPYKLNELSQKIHSILKN